MKIQKTLRNNGCDQSRDYICKHPRCKGKQQSCKCERCSLIRFRFSLKLRDTLIHAEFQLTYTLVWKSTQHVIHFTVWSRCYLNDGLFFALKTIRSQEQKFQMTLCVEWEVKPWSLTDVCIKVVRLPVVKRRVQGLVNCKTAWKSVINSQWSIIPLHACVCGCVFILSSAVTICHILFSIDKH